MGTITTCGHRVLTYIIVPQVANPHGKLIYTTREKTEDKFSFKARYAGRYAFCLTLSAHNSLSVSLRSTHRCATCTQTDDSM